MAKSDISTEDTISGGEALKIEEQHTKEADAVDITEWKAGSREWLIMGCLTLVTLVVVSYSWFQFHQLLDVAYHDNWRSLIVSQRN
jgi:hypothetical protein